MEGLFELARSLPPGLGVALLSAVPITELRGAIPFGMWGLGLSHWEAFAWAVLGNMLPVPLILFGLRPLHRLVGGTRWGAGLFRRLEEYARRRGRSVEQYEALGLFLFVAVPLPVTGAWTGSLVAAVLGLGAKRAILAIFMGVVSAGAVVTLLSTLGWWGALLAGVALLTAGAWGLLRGS